MGLHSNFQWYVPTKTKSEYPLALDWIFTVLDIEKPKTDSAPGLVLLSL